jgi:hypothetical protein
MHARLSALRWIKSTVPCMPWREIFPSSSSAWKALESCSSRVPCTQLDLICGPKVCPGYKRLCVGHCLGSYSCPNCLRCPPPFGVAAFSPSFLNLHPAGLPVAFHCLLTFLPFSVTDLPLHRRGENPDEWEAGERIDQERDESDDKRRREREKGQLSNKRRRD